MAATGDPALESGYQSLRADVHRLMATCFYPPAEGLSGDQVQEDLVATFQRVCPSAAEAARGLAARVAEVGAEELAVEHARLFVGPFELEAPPYGSIYLDEGRRVMGDSTLAVINAYADEGLVLDDQFGEMPDHIAAELEFLHYLASMQAAALTRNDRVEALRLAHVQQRLLATLVLPWIGQFCDRIRQADTSGVYARLADCLDTFLSADRAYIEQVLLPALKD